MNLSFWSWRTPSWIIMATFHVAGYIRSHVHLSVYQCKIDRSTNLFFHRISSVWTQGPVQMTFQPQLRYLWENSCASAEHWELDHVSKVVFWETLLSSVLIETGAAFLNRVQGGSEMDSRIDMASEEGYPYSDVTSAYCPTFTAIVVWPVAHVGSWICSICNN